MGEHDAGRCVRTPSRTLTAGETQGCPVHLPPRWSELLGRSRCLLPGTRPPATPALSPSRPGRSLVSQAVGKGKTVEQPRLVSSAEDQCP